MKHVTKMSDTELRTELDLALNMANIGRNPKWLPIIEKLSAEIELRKLLTPR